MDRIKVKGKISKHKVHIYTISTCQWCKKTKNLLKDNDIEYSYVDIDLCNEDEQKIIRDEIHSKGGSLTYPAIIVDDKIMINGYIEGKIRKVLEF